jgi:hypothetical protein
MTSCMVFVVSIHHNDPTRSNYELDWLEKVTVGLIMMLEMLAQCIVSIVT